jgi:cysteine-rich repeat protein
MVPGDSNGKKDVFVHDRSSTTTVRVSVASGGGQGNGDSSVAAIVADGTLVAFESLSTNLVPGDGNGVGDVFVRDLGAGVTTRVSVASDGTEANARSTRPVVSPDGRWVAFESTASNLVAGDSNGASDVFVHDRMTATTVRASVGTGGTQGSGASFAAMLSADGRFVLFESDAPDLVPDDTNATRDVFLHDLATGTTRRMGRGATQVMNATFAGALSADGRTIVFDSLDHDLVPGDTNNSRDVFVETPMCGDSALDVDETCDDGNLESGDGCDSNCTPTACGNGVVTDGEDCDDGDDDDTNACPNDCSLLRCGDGVVREPETCDDGNLESGDGCDSNCTPTGCGNTIVTAGEVCDDGGLVDGDGCDSNCTPTGCGNAIVTTGEVCDDGNVASGDGCDVNCTPTGCGNAVATAGEECDDGNAVDDDGCEADCLMTVCAGGLPIEKPVLRLVNLGPPFGNEHIVLSGVVRVDRETLDPAADGAQVLIEDRAEDGGRMLALTHATTPIPPGRPGTGCDDADGWRSDPPGSRHLYRNRSDAIDPAACTPGSAGGLDSLELEGHGRGKRPMTFRLMARHTTVERPAGPIRVMLVFGATAEAGLAGNCARHEFTDCDYDLSRTVLTCR